MKPIRLHIARGSGMAEIEAVAVNRWFAVHPHEFAPSWRVTHRPTGYSAGQAQTRAQAVAVARKLTTAYLGRWDFTDVNTARTIKGAKKVIRSVNGAWF